VRQELEGKLDSRYFDQFKRSLATDFQALERKLASTKQHESGSLKQIEQRLTVKVQKAIQKLTEVVN
jgi:hypothetical protein